MAKCESVMRVFYVCDRRACGAKCSGCNHTSDIGHAKNFEKVGDVYFEKPLSLQEPGAESVSDAKAKEHTISVKVEVDDSDLGATTERANRLVELLREASKIIDQLSFRMHSET